MNRLDRETRIRILSALVEGCSIRSTCRMTGAAKNTVIKLMIQAGRVASDYQDKTLRNLPCKRVQCDEIWSFIGCKEKNVPEGEDSDRGDVWTWTAICADTKIVPSWRVGTRDGETACDFISDLASRLANRVQLTTDGHKPYLEAVEGAFGCDIDYAMLIKMYGNEGQGVTPSERKYSPAQCSGSRREVITGAPDVKHVSTSYVERQNLTMRMSIRRFTRLTNAFSKKLENHAHAVALHFFNYNFLRIHKTLRVTPAMEAGVTDRLWNLNDLVDLIEMAEAEEDAARPVKPGRKAKKVESN